MNAILNISAEIEILREKEKIKQSHLMSKAKRYGLNISDSYHDFEYAWSKGLLSPNPFS
ncbi:hypothetical protein HN419_02490 [Candidatus Woesearchaeota archaeon]|nr:hypothetical protein [Candidatus Woesearchaeota archaeon]MBT3537135.1 hypothetical protein [Candidatus Woesearchaeota archaeon]MBT4697738.1 hypothetical protein [Candidatus Woesearchaeota archaeon]MBT4716558.1 hypothetical protein [Candidatus Woesearchaeota archaeon]MBT7106555.1 hypothetical protein [Candidatus Woesearchaeota archaeon]